eukprot:COSAG06_NODE_1889_length_8134_cov_3.277785_6_plen_95_part_00
MVVEFKGGNAVDYIVIKEDLTHGQRIAGWVRKRHFLSHLYIKINILPRQARDKHRENPKKAAVFPMFDRSWTSNWASRCAKNAFLCLPHLKLKL